MPNALQTDPLVLASRARDGDQQALAELYRRHSAALLRHARRMMGDDSAAQDIVQEAFARAIASIGRTREELHFKAWIFRITTNLCLRALTRAARCRPSEAPDQNVATSDDEADPERVRLRREAGVCVQEALGRLPDRYRQILLLREIEQLSYEELADVLELSKANVKVTLHRARARFAVAFISGQLLAPASAEDARGGDAGSDAELAAVGDDAECAQLEALMVQRERRALERHLEQCPRCREKEAQRCARRFAVLPPLPPLALGLSGLASGGAGASSAGATGATTTTMAGAAGSGAAGVGASAAAASSALGWVAAAAAGIAAALIVATVALGPSTRPARASDDQAKAHAATSPDKQVVPSARLASHGVKSVGRALAPATSASTPRARAHTRMNKTSRARRHRARRARTTRHARTSSRPRGRLVGASLSRRRFARSAARRGPVRQARDDESPPSYDINAGNRLAITARFASGTIEVRRRGGQRFTLQDSGQLRLRDKLVTRAGAQLTLLLPGHQWVVLRGAARLLSIPRRGASSGKVHIALLRGVIRARGNQRGGGVTIHQGRRRVHTASGEMRLRLRAGGALAVSSIDATVDVSGPHAPRVVSAGSGLVLDQRPGFAHALLSAPTSLRPVVFRGPRAPRLRWKTVASARRYRVLVGRDADFFQIVERADITSTSYTPRLSGLSGKFYWKVIALGEAKRGAPSKIYGFRIEKNDD